MANHPIIPLHDQNLLLLPQKAIYWFEEKALIAADVHLGKGGHFRKSGIAIPRQLAQEDLSVLSDLIRTHQPEKLIFLGDLFHSHKNTDWDWFALWRQQFPALHIILVLGNHDIIDERHYLDLGISVHTELKIGPFLMLHHPVEAQDLANFENCYVFCGHIHPGVTLKGKGRQTVTLPCFIFGEKQAIMPSFGKFTGRISVKSTPSDRVFAILDDKIIPF